MALPGQCPSLANGRARGRLEGVHDARGRGRVSLDRGKEEPVSAHLERGQGEGGREGERERERERERKI